jgi:hypothetical protein
MSAEAMLAVKFSSPEYAAVMSWSPAGQVALAQDRVAIADGDRRADGGAAIKKITEPDGVYPPLLEG